MKTEDSVIYLVSCAVKQKIPDKALISEMDLAAVHDFASRHMLNAAVSMALESAGYEDEKTRQSIGIALRKVLTLESEKNSLFHKLEEAGIWHMPLKGAVLKDYYPKLGMREMSDYDILFDASRAKDVRKIMESSGFSTTEFGIQNEDVYRKAPLTLFEMHRTLFGARHGKIIFEYYANVKERLGQVDDKNYAYHFIPEDFYIYMITHEYIHYSTSGTGLRSILDTYIFLREHELDWSYIESEISKLGITDFEIRNRSLALHVFNAEELNNEERQMLDYVISSGTYGTIQNAVENEISKRGRLAYFLSRLTLPYPQMLEEYPVLRKIPVLYPFFWLYRLLVRGLFSRRKKFICQMRILLNWNKEHVN